jgi:two-component system nitrate/nitrite response regulator NarL
MQVDDRGKLIEDDRRWGVFIATPIKLYRDGIAHFLRGSARFEVLGTADGGPTTVRLAQDLRPDVIMLDMAMDRSRDTARTLRLLLPRTPIVALAVSESEGEVVDCVEAGVSAYVPREGSLDELLTTLGLAVKGEAECSGPVTGELIRRLATLGCHNGSRGEESLVAARLTAREAEVVSLIDDGLSNKQIARRLCIELSTVKNHVHSILEKLGARSRGEAAARARRLPVT